MPTAVVYSRQGCHLCEIMIERLLAFRGLELDIRDVDERDDWQAAFGQRVPVLVVDGDVVCEYRLDAAALQRIREHAVGRA